MNHDCKICAFNSRVIDSIDNESLDELSNNHIVVSFKKGDSIIKQGTFSTNVAFLRTGLVKVHISGPYYEQIVKIKKAPTYLGLPTTFGNKVNQYSVTAITECEVCFIDVEIFRNILKNNHQFAYEIIVELCQYELDSFKKCADRTQKQSRGNIASVLLDFSDKIFESNSFCCPISQSEIGNLVDTSRENVSRILSEFEKDGIIGTKGKNLEILNKNTLKLISKKG